MSAPRAGVDAPPSGGKAWAADLGWVLLVALFMTPAAGLVGGAVIGTAMLLSGVGTLMTLLSFTLLGGLYGVFAAAPVTLGVLPAAGFLLLRIRGGARFAWSLPLLGLFAGALRMVEDPARFTFDIVPAVVALAGGLAGLVAGGALMLLVRVRRRDRPR